MDARKPEDLILPDRVMRNGRRREGHALVIDDLGEVLDECPFHLVVGTGADGRMHDGARAVDAALDESALKCPW